MNSKKGSNGAQRADEVYDFIEDPLYARSVTKHEFKRFAHLKDKDFEQNNWEVFHWSTRSKLEAAIYFYAQVQGWASVRAVSGMRCEPDALLDWYIDAFFYELVSAFDVLLQEINVAYQCGLEIEDVTWGGKEGKPGIRELLKGKNEGLRELLNDKYEHARFVEVRRWRNYTAHRSRIPKASMWAGGGEVLPETPEVNLRNPDTDDRIAVSKLKDYVNFIADLVKQVWKQFPAGVNNETG